MNNVISPFVQSWQCRAPSVTERPEAYSIPLESSRYQAPDPAPKRKQRKRVSGLAWYPRLGLWKAASVTLNPETMESLSYDWWVMSKRFGDPNGVLVVNSYRYSVTTAKHQSKLRGWLRQHGHTDWLEIEAPRGLQDLDSAIRLYQSRIETLEAEINRKGTKTAKNLERRAAISDLNRMIALVETLKGGAV